ncbi:MAG: hypothetical protein N2321_02035 [Melioribacteraceae bacterium]|nr:hypothetical protein [Melioribacteraceae bacterium]
MKNFLLLISISAGIFFPYGHNYVFLIRYFLMLLLFFSFLDINVNKKIIHIKHFLILGIIVFSSLLFYFLLNIFNHEIAQAVFITSIAPTAIAAPVIISLRKKNIEFVMFSLLLNNIAISLLIPFLLPTITNSENIIKINEVLFPVLITISVPLIVSQLFKYLLPAIWKKLVAWKDSSYYILIVNIYIAVSDASTFIRSENDNNLHIALLIAISSALLCIFYFTLGWLIGGKNFSAEASQSLGQKNNAFTIWIALTYLSPLVALGPVFYVLYQNIYISWVLYKNNK